MLNELIGEPWNIEPDKRQACAGLGYFLLCKMKAYFLFIPSIINKINWLSVFVPKTRSLMDMKSVNLKHQKSSNEGTFLPNSSSFFPKSFDFNRQDMIEAKIHLLNAILPDSIPFDI